MTKIVSQVPRIAVGTIQPGADTQAIVWGLLDAFRREGVQAQNFHCRAHFPRCDGALSITGLPSRYLDSWLMSPDTCRQLFCRASRGVDLAVVEGSFLTPGENEEPGGRLEPLCRWLDLPRLVILDVSRLCTCCRPGIPIQADGLLLDGISDAQHLARLSTDLELLWGIPVLGALDRVPELRAALAQTPRGGRVESELCRRLGDNFRSWWKPQRILALAGRREAPQPEACPGCCRHRSARLTVAIAYDEAFQWYFPDVLELLELQGASIVDFSPLRDEHLPPQSDVVYFGCGHPERYASVLAENHCMFAALRSHLCAGRRIYGEGGGTAYLCQQMETPSGKFQRMAGILPATARLVPPSANVSPIEVTVPRPNWLANAGVLLRGYRNASWQFEVSQNPSSPTHEEASPHHLLGTFQAVGSALHLDFAAYPACLYNFFSPDYVRAGDGHISPQPLTHICPLTEGA
jgi:cobyrinic acid a,c-diamide synthase